MKKSVLIVLLLFHFLSFSQKLQTVKLIEIDYSTRSLSNNLVLYTKRYKVLSEDYTEGKEISLQVFKLKNNTGLFNILWSQDNYELLFSAQGSRLKLFRDGNIITSFHKKRKFVVKEIGDGDYQPVSLLIEKRYIEYRYEIVEQNVQQGDYIQMEDYKKLNIPYVLKRSKKKSEFTGMYQFNESNILKIIELDDGKVVFSLDLFNGTNLGYLEGLVELKDSVAIFEDETLGYCHFKMTINSNSVLIETINNGQYCGFGNGVYVDNNYVLISKGIPIFNKDN